MRVCVCVEASTALNEADKTKRDIGLSYIFASVENSCKAIAREERCPQEA